MRALYLPGQGFRVVDDSVPHYTLLSYTEAREVSPLFEPVLYAVLVEAQSKPWTWIDGD